MEPVEKNQNYERYSSDSFGQAYESKLKEARSFLDEVSEGFKALDITPDMLKEFKTFEQVFLAIMVIKFQMMLDKQKDYKSGNIEKLKVTGILKRAGEKIERAYTLIGDPDEQVASSKNVINNLDEEATAAEMDLALREIWKILNPQNAVKNEKVDDTLMDLGNYGDIAYAYFHSSWGKPLAENL